VKGYSTQQIRDAEAPLLEAGVPLMRRAASALAAQLRQPGVRRVVLLVGTGDNGGDALYAGAELAPEGVDVAVIAAEERMHEAALAEALARGAHIESATNTAELADTADVILDGLVGIGGSGPLRGGALKLVIAAAGTRTPVVAVDIPSGIDPNTGELPGPVLPAVLTVTFGACKAGLLLKPARTVAGQIRVIDLGLDLSGVDPIVEV
jgi:hydroxyethylthiazole kinase-like uncharacterized protein yjeF